MGIRSNNQGIIASQPIQRISAWIAMLAVLMMALAPTVSGLLQRDASTSANSFWMDICTALVPSQAAPGPAAITEAARNGFAAAVTAFASPVTSAPAGSQRSQVPTPHDVAAHCPYCLMHANAVMDNPPVVRLLLAALPLYQILPRLFYQSPQPLFAWIIAPSRAPPAIS